MCSYSIYQRTFKSLFYSLLGQLWIFLIILLGVSGCTGFTQELNNALSGNSSKNSSSINQPKDATADLQEQIAKLQLEVKIMREELDTLRPSVEELTAIDEDIRKLLSQLSNMNNASKKRTTEKETIKQTKPKSKTNKTEEKESTKNKKPISLTNTVAKKVDPEKQLGVHLASFKKLESARKGWKEIVVAQEDILAGLDYRVSQVEISGKKGAYFRLKAGPFTDKNSATETCKLLKKREAYCVVTDFTGKK